MTDQLERDLTQMFARHADEVEIPPVPVVLLDAPAARPRRGRTLALVAAAAAVAAAVAIPIGLAARDGDEVQPAPAPNTPQVTGAPAIDVPYLLHGELHVGTLTLSTAASGIVAFGDGVLVAQGADTVTWRRLDGDRLVAAPYLDEATQVAVSYDGGVVAGRVDQGGTQAVRIWNAASGTVLDTIPLAAPPVGHDPWQLGFDAGGRLYWQDGTTPEMRNPDGTVVNLAAGGRSLIGIAPTGPLLMTGAAERVEVATMRADGTVAGASVVPVSTSAAWSESGQLAYVAVGDGRLYATQPQIGTEPVEVPVAGSRTAQPLGWSDGKVVVISYGATETRVLLIDPATGDAEELFTVAINDEGYGFPAVGGTGAL